MSDNVNDFEEYLKSIDFHAYSMEWTVNGAFFSLLPDVWFVEAFFHLDYEKNHVHILLTIVVDIGHTMRYYKVLNELNSKKQIGTFYFKNRRVYMGHDIEINPFEPERLWMILYIMTLQAKDAYFAFENFNKL